MEFYAGRILKPIKIWNVDYNCTVVELVKKVLKIRPFHSAPLKFELMKSKWWRQIR